MCIFFEILRETPTHSKELKSCTAERKKFEVLASTIKLNRQITESLEFTIYNSLGQSLRNFQLNSNDLQIDLSNLSSGLYYYSIKKKGEIIIKNKIIKK